MADERADAEFPDPADLDENHGGGGVRCGTAQAQQGHWTIDEAVRTTPTYELLRQLTSPTFQRARSELGPGLGFDQTTVANFGRAGLVMESEVDERTNVRAPAWPRIGSKNSGRRTFGVYAQHCHDNPWA